MDKKTYDVAPGVAWVNGAPTPKDRKVELTAAQAQYDLGLGRISLAGPAKAPAKD
ncbi:hypothetical protein [Devosia sp. 1635]|uniref:hypothetical protein n=1 Tax=Devosia sp. 1635 TaxID=2726066 RepID=UPI0015661E5A|nr:hypothetical protein [Devosia sp. 1635]